MSGNSILLLRGDDLTAFAAQLSSAKKELGDGSALDMNTATFDGETLNFDELVSACMTMPFLSEKRLVVIEKARPFLAKQGKASADKALAFFSEIPGTTVLILEVEDSLKPGKNRAWENAKQYEWLVKFLHDKPELGKIINCELPGDKDMPVWIARQANEKGGKFTAAAAAMLASYIGNDTLRVNHEIEKLLTYAQGRDVSDRDVVLLTAQEQEGNIFTLTDALGERDGKKAMREFRILAEESDMVELAPMVQRHIRQLIQAREILDEGGQPKQVEEELNLIPFVAQKLCNQARRFSLKQLISIYAKLLEVDESMKTGGLPGEIQFEVLIAELTK